MAALPESDRLRVWRGLMRKWSSLREIISSVPKADLKSAVDYTDGWIDANQASWNGGLPTTVKNNLTQEQKTLLFCSVATMRASLDLLKSLLNVEVD